MCWQSWARPGGPKYEKEAWIFISYSNFLFGLSPPQNRTLKYAPPPQKKFLIPASPPNIFMKISKKGRGSICPSPFLPLFGWNGLKYDLIRPLRDAWNYFEKWSILFHYWRFFSLVNLDLKWSKIWLDVTIGSIWVMSYFGSIYLAMESAALGDTILLERGAADCSSLALDHGTISFWKIIKIYQNAKHLLQGLWCCVSEYLQLRNVDNAMIYLFPNGMHNLVELFQKSYFYKVKGKGVLISAVRQCKGHFDHQCSYNYSRMDICWLFKIKYCR